MRTAKKPEVLPCKAPQMLRIEHEERELQVPKHEPRTRETHLMHAPQIPQHQGPWGGSTWTVTDASRKSTGEAG